MINFLAKMIHISARIPRMMSGISMCHVVTVIFHSSVTYLSKHKTR